MLRSMDRARPKAHALATTEAKERRRTALPLIMTRCTYCASSRWKKTSLWSVIGRTWTAARCRRLPKSLIVPMTRM